MLYEHKKREARKVQVVPAKWTVDTSTGKRNLVQRAVDVQFRTIPGPRIDGKDTIVAIADVPDDHPHIEAIKDTFDKNPWIVPYFDKDADAKKAGKRREFAVESTRSSEGPSMGGDPAGTGVNMIEKRGGSKRTIKGDIGGSVASRGDE